MKRLECLDGLRGALAAYVLLGHMAPFAVLPDLLQSAVSHGGAAVDLFFVLSGLVVTQSLERAGGRARPFLIARAARIFPVFLPVFAFAVAVQPWSCGFEQMPWIGPENAARTICAMAWPHAWGAEIAAHLAMAHGLFPDAVLPDVWVSFLGAAWSLSTEWQFYLLALAFAGRPRALARVLFGLAIAAVAWREAGPEAWQFSRAFLPNKAHFFALGVASLAVARGERTGRPYALGLLACFGICATSGTFGKLLPPLAWALCLAAATEPASPVMRPLRALLRWRATQYLGAISYCLYLVNEPVHKVAVGLLAGIAGGDAMVFTVLWVPVATLLPVAVSAWLHVRLEAPALRWGHAIARRARPERPHEPVQARQPGL
jgi:peptidoglycan/LPS O-acetylase OafA/YrhL